MNGKDNVGKGAEIISRGGKARGKYESWYNIRDTQDSSVKAIDWHAVENWKPMSDESEVFLSTNEIGVSELAQSKLEELNKLRTHNVYERVKYTGQECVSVRWVNKTKIVDGVRQVKSRMVARGFEENSDNIQKDSPTCAKESLRLSLALIASNKWKLRSIDIKSAFLQGKKIDRDVYLFPPVEAGEAEEYVWKLNTCIYGLTDASRTWYLSVKEFLNGLGVYECRYDPCILCCYDDQRKLCGILCTHVDDFLFAGTSGFKENVIDPLKCKFSIRTEAAGAFEYLGLRVIQHKDFSITIDQHEYVDLIEAIHIEPSRRSCKNELLLKKEKRALRSLIGQLGWIAG